MAANTDKFRKVARRWVGQIGSGGVADAVVTTVPLASATNLPTDTAVCIVVDRVDSSGTATPTTEETIVGVVSGSNLVNCLRGVEGTAQAHSAGAVVEVLVTADNINDLIDGILVEHNQLGGHTDITACDITASGTVTALTAIVTGQTTASDIAACDVTAQDVTAQKVTAGDDVTVADAKDIKFTSGAKIERDDGHIVLTPETSKLVKIAVLRQDDTANTYKPNSVILTGWGYLNGGGVINVEEAVTFGITFAEVPIVTVSSCGYNGSVPTHAGDFGSSYANFGAVWVCGFRTVSATGIGTVQLRCEVGFTFTNNVYWGYHWHAIGVL